MVDEEKHDCVHENEPPAMGERRARWGYGYQDKAATERILDLLRKDLRDGNLIFEGVRLADLDAGRADDFVLVWEKAVEGSSIKWSGDAVPLNWGDLVGTNGLLKELADGYQRLGERWPEKVASVRLQTNRPPSTATHHSQLISYVSVADFVRNHWSSGPTSGDSAQLRDVWLKISEHVGLDGIDFTKFVSACSLSLGCLEPPGGGPDTQDWRHYKKQFDDLHKAIATWFTNNPQGDFIDRHVLLSAIGYKSFRSGLIQSFPLPKIPYSKNGTSADQLKQLIDTTAGGYIAIVGPAGIGKSTLVQDVLSDAQYPFFIPYYAFLPETDGNRDRGEALTCFQDVIGRLDKFFKHRYSLGISDIAQGREALREHMAKANEQYVSQGYKTILLIDGLDHVSREINLQSTLLQELPKPEEVPDGFLIILSSQPQALIPGTIAAQVGNVVAPQSDRRIEVSGLARTEVHATCERIDKASTGPERDALYNASRGNPLILTYLLNLFQRTPDTTVDQAVALAGEYAGDIEEYYQSTLSVPLQDGQTRQLLGLICRAAPTIPVTWLQEWPEHIQIENIYEHILAPFIQVDDGNLHFIHNSLVAFLKLGTGSRLPGVNPAVVERTFHSTLADRCGDRPCVDPIGRAKVQHLLRAHKNNDLLAVLSSGWIRQAIEAFLPYALIRPLLVSGLEAAWNMGDFGGVLRLILLGNELDQRTSRIEAGDLAQILLSLDSPELAISQIRAVGQLLVEDSVVLKFARNLWFYADSHDRSELKNVARTLYQQAKPVSYIYQNEPIDTLRQHEYSSILRTWSEAAPLFEGCGDIVAQTERLRIKVDEVREDIDEVSVKTSLLYGALLTRMKFESGIDDCKFLLDEITSLGQKTWRFAALLKLAKKYPGLIALNALAEAYVASGRDKDIDLAYARFLYIHGESTEAKKVTSSLSHIRFDAMHNNHSYGFSDVSYSITLQRLQELLELPQDPVPDVNEDREEASARVETVARKIGVLSATVKRTGGIPDLSATIRSLLLFHNQAVVFADIDFRNKHIVLQAKLEIFKNITSLVSAIGIEGLESLRDNLLDLINGPTGIQYTAHHRRYFAVQLFRRGVLLKEQAVELGLSSTLDANDEDPMQRQEACLEISAFLHAVGEDVLSAQWVKRAGEVSAGAGSHKDYHMAYLADWLSRSVSGGLSARKMEVLEKFARAVKVAGGDGTSQAATHVLQLILRHDPIRASLFAIELIDRNVLNVSQVLEALLLGGARVGASAALLNSFYGEILLLIDPAGASDVAVEILRCFPAEGRVTAAKVMMACVRTNALPEHRIGIARSLEDALLQDGCGSHLLKIGLLSGSDDSSYRSSLYKRPTGETETREQVAVRLSNHASIGEWNPYPEENAEFDWWEAIKRAEVKDVSHLNDLLSSFSLSDYREVDVLCWRSRQLLAFGEFNDAKCLAEQAVKQANDSTWHLWLDGAQKRIAYEALKLIDRSESLSQARLHFGKDLAAGKCNSSYLLSDIMETLDSLEIDWPGDAVFRTIDDYLDHVLAANQEEPQFDSLINPSTEGSVDEALCRVLVCLLAFPVVDVGVAARKVLSQYLAVDGTGLLALIKKESFWDSVQLEHLLVCLHVGSRKNDIEGVRGWVLNLNTHDSIAVRGVARRLCEKQGWAWEEINDQERRPVILLSESMGSPRSHKEALDLIDGNISSSLMLHRGIFDRLEGFGLDADELRSEFYRFFREIENNYNWVDKSRLDTWIHLMLTKQWLRPSSMIGREAAMRVLGRRALSGQAPPGAEEAYDALYPIYDPKLELLQPVERPAELKTMEWRLWDDEGKAWLRGEKADSWNEYPETVDAYYIIGERSFFIRPEWEWPRESRVRGLILDFGEPEITKEWLETSHELTFESYLLEMGQTKEQLTVLNAERQLIGPAYRWAAINSSFARSLGWEPSDDEPLGWIDASGNLMVKSIYWRDGWIGLQPPRFDSLGDGWLVLATETGMRSIREASSDINLHLWVERASSGDSPYEEKWHLSKSL